MKFFNNGIFRILDANMNRALEGIRVLEETARMLFNDIDLTKKIKETRHSLIQIIKEESDLDCLMLFSRGSERDILRDNEIIPEKTRIDMNSIVKANASRAQEAVRTMEEYIKLSFPHLSGKFKNVRFNLYDIEKAIVTRIHLSELINENRLSLCVIIDRKLAIEKDIYEISHAVTDGGAGTVTYRDKISCDFDFMKNAELMLHACVNREVTTIIENRLDIAMIIHADGVSVGYHDIPVKACRSITGKAFVIGLSLPFDKSLSDKIDDEVDYYIIGPVFESEKNVKSNLKALNEFVSLSHVPIVAFGGITIDNIASLFDCGVTGIAVTPDFSTPVKTNKELQNYKKIIETYKAGRSSE